MIDLALSLRGGPLWFFSWPTCWHLDAVGAQCLGQCHLKSFLHPLEPKVLLSRLHLVRDHLLQYLCLPGLGLTNKKGWLWNFIIGLITPPLIQETDFGAYVFFAVFCLLAFVWTYFCVPETNGKTLEEMDESFHDRTGTADVERKAIPL